MVNELQIITGIDIPAKDLGMTLRQPKVREVAMLGEQEYFLALQLFTMSKQDLGVEREEITNWSIFQEAIDKKIDGIDNTRTLLTNFLQLFVIGKPILGPRSIMVDTAAELINIEGEQFTLFQDYIGAIGGKSLLSASEEKFNPKNSHAAAIAEKMKRARKRIAAQKAPEVKSHKGFLSRYVKSVATVTANSLEEVSTMSVLQLNELMRQYLSWEEYDLEIRGRLAGAKGDDKLVHWTIKDSSTETSSLGTV